MNVFIDRSVVKGVYSSFFSGSILWCMHVLVFNRYCIAGSDLVFVHSAIDPACRFLFGNHQSLSG